MKKLITIVIASLSLLFLSLLSQAQYINVRLYDGVDSFRNSFWNNWKMAGTGRTNDSSRSFSDIFGNPTKIRAVLGNDGTVFDNGRGYKAGNLWLPDTVIRKVVYNSEPISFTLTGLDDSSIYSLVFYSSLYKLSGEGTVFTTGAASVTVMTDSNSFRSAIFNGLVTKGGKVLFTIKNVKTYSALNGFELVGVPKKLPIRARIVIDSTVISYPNSVVRVTDSSTGPVNSEGWLQVSGPKQAIFTDVSALQLYISGLIPGTYRFQLTVSDPVGNTDSAFVNVTVKPPPVCAPPRMVTGVSWVVVSGVWLPTFTFSDGSKQ